MNAEFVRIGDEFNERELAFDEVTESRIAQPLGTGFKMFHIFLVRRVDGLASDIGR